MSFIRFYTRMTTLFKILDTHQILRFYYQLALGKGCCLSIQTNRNQSKIEVSFWIFNFQIKHFVLITDLFQLIHILDLYFTLHTHHLSPNHLICNRIRGHTLGGAGRNRVCPLCQARGKWIKLFLAE